jgi:long-chain acyl-CoA synthetase
MTEEQVSQLLATLPVRISDILQPWAERFPDRPALVEASGTWTYAQLSLAVDETRAWLLGCGVRAGDRVMVVCENCRTCIAILFALARLDAWTTLVNARLSAREIDGIQDHCGARLVLYTTGVSPHAREHAKRNAAVIRAAGILGPVGIGRLNEKTNAEPIEPGQASNVAVLIYTSGTTGLPKGVMLTHRNLLFIAAVSAKLRQLRPEDRIYGVLPMSHAVGLSVVVLGCLLSGATLYLAPRFDPVAALAALENERLTIVLGVPSMFALLAEYAKSKGIPALKFPALRIISSSGAPLHPALKSEVENLFGQVLHNGYGVTETSPNVAQTRLESPRTDTSVGRIFPGVEVQLVDRDRKPVAPGEVGELWVRGPNVMKGYYRAPEETAAAIDREGWFNTRDLAHLEEGHLFIVGRTKELIIRFGFNVYPAEVEGVLNMHTAVVRSAVIGRSVGGEEEVIAFVQLSPRSQISVADLAAHAARHLTPYKQPSQIFIVPTMPTTPTGKVKKDELAKTITDALANNR